MKALILTFVTLFSTPLFAQEFTPYLGVYTGFNSLNGKGSETDKSGFNLGAKVLGSWNFDEVITDAGLGWQYNKMQGGGVTVTTRSVFLELDARYKFTRQLSVGPILTGQFGVDNTQSETEGSASTTVMAGIKAVYQISQDWRFEANVQNSITGTDERSNLVANIGLQWALPWDRTPETSVPRRETPKKSSFKPLPQPKKAVVNNDNEVPDVKVSLKSARVGFATDAYKLDSETSKKLATLGKYLSQNPELYGRIKISGHTDVTGAKEHNISLSQDRADSVMDALVKGGVPEDKIQARGFGPNRPVDSRNTPEAYELNRRTEIEFYEVSDRVKLNKALVEILK